MHDAKKGGIFFLPHRVMPPRRLRRGVFNIRPSQIEKSSFERTSFFQRCVPLARNVMCPSGVMFASQVMCASRVRSGTRHTTLRQRRNTSLWQSHNITAATPQHHSQRFAPPISHKRLATPSILCYTNHRKAVGI